MTDEDGEEKVYTIECSINHPKEERCEFNYNYLRGKGKKSFSVAPKKSDEKAKKNHLQISLSSTLRLQNKILSQKAENLKNLGNISSDGQEGNPSLVELKRDIQSRHTTHFLNQKSVKKNLDLEALNNPSQKSNEPTLKFNDDSLTLEEEEKLENSSDDKEQEDVEVTNSEISRFLDC